jgi:hypothetical protein
MTLPFYSAIGRVNVADFFQYSNRTKTALPIVKFPNANLDWRVRINLAPNSTYFYHDANNILLSPLASEPGMGGGSATQLTQAITKIAGQTPQTRVGVIFPYTPQVTVTHAANYTAQKLTHSNYTNYFYDNSEVQAINISGEFTVQSIDEGQYLLATIYFLRSLTKMFFGMDANAGNPPPLVYLNGYGQYYFPNVSCVVTNFSHTMPSDVDYVNIPEPAVNSMGADPQITNYPTNSTRLPTTSTISLILQPVYSRTSQSGYFSLEDFARGSLIAKSGVNPEGNGFTNSQSGPYVPSSRPGNSGFL